jgi:PAS domain-containing protein/DNA-binding CsgD family transcriptional regulator
VTANGDLFGQQSAIATVSASVQPVVLIELPSQEIVAVSDRVLAMLEATREQLIGRPAADFVAQEPSGALTLLATGRLDGAEAGRILAGPDGDILPVRAWAHVLGRQRPPRYAIILLVESASKRAAQPDDEDVRVFGVVDDTWRIDHISSTVTDLLGYLPEDLAGRPLTNFVHDDDIPEILTGLASAHNSKLDTLTRIRLLRSDDRWQETRMRVGSLARAPGFGFVLRALPDPPSPEPTDGLEEFLACMSGERLADAEIMPGPFIPTSRQLPSLTELNSKQWEILVRLASGAPEDQVARSLDVDLDEVRRHLLLIFVKLGVTDVGELTDLLEAASGVVPRD